GPRALAGLREDGLQRVHQLRRCERGGTMIVDQAARCGFVGGSERAQRVGDIVVDSTLKLGGLVAYEKRGDEKEQLRLPAAEVAHALEHHAEVALLLTHGDCGRMLAGAGKPGTVARALDFDQALGAATHRTDLFAERRAAAARAPHAAERRDPERIIV